MFLKKIYWGVDNIWVVGYFISTVGEINGEIIVRYVENQGKEENEVIEIEL